jgi:N-acetylneuraminate synthase
MTYLEYRYRVEFGVREYDAIDAYCKERKLDWFASPWDESSVDFLERYSPICYKIPSAALTDHRLLKSVRSTGRPLILSTGMSTMDQIRDAVSLLGSDNLMIAHCTSTYPCKPQELNLRVIQTLRDEFDCPIGYSGHEVGLQTTYAAIVLGASFVERHITLDRAMWGSDQSASIEPSGLARLVRDIRVIDQSLGDGIKRRYESEVPVMAKLRRVGA